MTFLSPRRSWISIGSAIIFEKRGRPAFAQDRRLPPPDQSLSRAPGLHRRDVLHNLGSHKGKAVRKATEPWRLAFLFLPKYSPIRSSRSSPSSRRCCETPPTRTIDAISDALADILLPIFRQKNAPTTSETQAMRKSESRMLQASFRRCDQEAASPAFSLTNAKKNLLPVTRDTRQTNGKFSRRGPRSRSDRRRRKRHSSGPFGPSIESSAARSLRV